MRAAFSNSKDCGILIGGRVAPATRSIVRLAVRQEAWSNVRREGEYKSQDRANGPHLYRSAAPPEVPPSGGHPRVGLDTADLRPGPEQPLVRRDRHDAPGPDGEPPGAPP